MKIGELITQNGMVLRVEEAKEPYTTCAGCYGEDMEECPFPLLNCVMPNHTILKYVEDIELQSKEIFGVGSTIEYKGLLLKVEKTDEDKGCKGCFWEVENECPLELDCSTLDVVYKDIGASCVEKTKVRQAPNTLYKPANLVSN